MQLRSSIQRRCVWGYFWGLLLTIFGAVVVMARLDQSFRQLDLMLVVAPLATGLAVLAISASINSTVKVCGRGDDQEEPLLPGIASKRALSTRSMERSSILVTETGVAYWTAVGMVFVERDRDIWGDKRLRSMLLFPRCDMRLWK